MRRDFVEFVAVFARTLSKNLTQSALTPSPKRASAFELIPGRNISKGRGLSDVTTTGVPSVGSRSSSSSSVSGCDKG